MSPFRTQLDLQKIKIIKLNQQSNVAPFRSRKIAECGLRDSGSSRASATAVVAAAAHSDHVAAPHEAATAFQPDASARLFTNVDGAG